MILLYINNDLANPEYKRKRKLLTESIWYYFGATLILSERNYPALISMIKYQKPIQFIVESINDFDLTATEISEMIIVMINQGTIFISIADSLYFDSSNKLDIYPTIFSYFKESN